MVGSDEADARAGGGGQALPIGYRSLTPLFSEQHGALRFRRRRDFAFASALHAAPLALDEFMRAQAHYPIVFTRAAPSQPVALLGMSPGRNDFVDEDGAWRDGAYVPAYLRRFPFALVKENAASGRMLLCADLTAPNFEPGSDEEALFDGAIPSSYATNVLAFCTRFEQALAKTRQAAQRMETLGLLEDAKISVRRKDYARPIDIDGFKVVSETKLRALDDGPLLELARGGVIGLIAAHQMSIARFSDVALEGL